MASRQTERKTTGNTGQGGGTGLGAPGTTGAYGARDPLGAPGSTGASRTTAGAPGYDPTEYGSEDMGGQQQQLRRPAADDMGTGQGYTYGTAGSMGTTGTGYHAGVHVPHTTGTGLSGTYGTSGGFDTGGFGKSGGGGGGGGFGEGFDTGMGERTHGMGRERGGNNPVVASETVVIESVGGLNDQDIGDQMDEWAQSIGTGERARKASNDTGGAKQRDGQRRG